MKHPNKLRHFRELSGYSKKQVANYLGLKNEITITRWENGETLPKNGYMVLKIAALYKVLLFDLYPAQYKQAQKEVSANAKKYGIKLHEQPATKRTDKKVKPKKA